MKCFYHSSDLDGHCSGAIVKLKHPDCEMIGINYGDSFPWDTIQKDELVFMVDFSLQPYEQMNRLAGECELIWIDHHISAIKEHEHYGIGGNVFYDLSLDNTKAGCELTWEYLFTTPEPVGVYLLGRYDVWDLEADKRIMPFQWGMRMYDTYPDADEPNIWADILDPTFNPAEIIKDGELLLEYRDMDNDKYIKSCAFETEFEELRAIAVNKGMTNSQLFDSVWNELKYDIMLTFVWRKGQWTISLYTTHKHIDVSEIAKKHGGGGHKGAAGFQTQKLSFLK